jgi:hypothetical protein
MRKIINQFIIAALIVGLPVNANSLSFSAMKNEKVHMAGSDSASTIAEIKRIKIFIARFNVKKSEVYLTGSLDLVSGKKAPPPFTAITISYYSGAPINDPAASITEFTGSSSHQKWKTTLSFKSGEVPCTIKAKVIVNGVETTFIDRHRVISSKTLRDNPGICRR